MLDGKLVDEAFALEGLDDLVQLGSQVRVAVGDDHVHRTAGEHAVIDNLEPAGLLGHRLGGDIIGHQHVDAPGLQIQGSLVDAVIAEQVFFGKQAGIQQVFGQPRVLGGAGLDANPVSGDIFGIADRPGKGYRAP